MNGQIEIELDGLYGTDYRICGLPKYGTVRIDESGKLFYKPLHNYTGFDIIQLLIYDKVSEYKTVTVDLNVG